MSRLQYSIIDTINLFGSIVGPNSNEAYSITNNAHSSFIYHDKQPDDIAGQQNCLSYPGRMWGGKVKRWIRNRSILAIIPPKAASPQTTISSFLLGQRRKYICLICWGFWCISNTGTLMTPISTCCPSLRPTSSVISISSAVMPDSTTKKWIALLNRQLHLI